MLSHGKAVKHNEFVPLLQRLDFWVNLGYNIASEYAEQVYYMHG